MQCSAVYSKLSVCCVSTVGLTNECCSQYGRNDDHTPTDIHCGHCGPHHSVSLHKTIFLTLVSDAKLSFNAHIFQLCIIYKFIL